MRGLDAYLESQFARATCPVCGGVFAKCGLPNHIRRHKNLARRKAKIDRRRNRSVAWWDGWKEGYKLGLRDGSKKRH